IAWHAHRQALPGAQWIVSGRPAAVNLPAGSRTDCRSEPAMSEPPAPADPRRLLAELRARTPARVLVGRAGASYRTPTQLALRADHAAARDAVWAEVDLARDLGADLVARLGLFEVSSRAGANEQY